MVRSLFISLLFMTITCGIHAQPYHSYTYQIAPYFTFTKSILNAGNGYVISGNCSDSTGTLHRVFIMKCDSAGNLLWFKTYGEDSSNYWDGFPRCMGQFSNGNYALAGIFENASGAAYQLYCFDQNGDSVWMYRNQPTGSDYLHQGRVNDADQFVTVGYSDTAVHNVVNVFDASGQLVYDTSIVAGDIFLYSIDVMESGGYIFGGRFEPFAFDWFSITRTTDQSFSVTDSYSDPGSIIDDGPFSVSATSDSGYIACAYMVDSLTPLTNIPVTYLPVVVKFDKNGVLQWRKVVQPSYYDAGISQVKEAADGNYFAIGYFYTSDQYYWTMLIKFDTLGNVLWKRKVTHVLSQDAAFIPLDFVETTNHGMAVAGYSFSLTLNDTIGNRGWLLLVDSSGCGQPSRPYNLSSTSAPSTFGAGLHLSWSDTTGYNNRYIIERSCSNPPETWRVINSAATMSSQTTYIDSGLIIGATYCYCITALDDNGRMSCSSDTICVITVGSEEIAPVTISADFYPMPANQELHFRFSIPNRDEEYILHIYNAAGQQIISQKLSTEQISGFEEVIVDTKHLPAGTYTFTLISQQTLLSSDQFIIIH